MLDDKEFVIEMIKINNDFRCFVSERIRRDKKTIKECVDIEDVISFDLDEEL